MEDSFNPEEEQKQELMVLQSILMDEFQELEPEKLNEHRHRRRCALTILPHPSAHEANYVQVVLEVTLEPTYPILLPLLHVTNAPAASHKLSDAMLAELADLLKAVSREHAGSVHLMALAEKARDFLCPRNIPEPKPISAHEQMIMRQLQEGTSKLDMTVIPVSISHQSSPKQNGRGGVLSEDGPVSLETVEAELDIKLQALQRKRKQSVKRRKARGAVDIRAGEASRRNGHAHKGADDSSEEEEPSKMALPRSVSLMGAPRHILSTSGLAPRELLPPPIMQRGQSAAAPVVEVKKPSQASAFAEAAVDAGRKMWGSVKELLSSSGAAWSRENGRGVEEETSDGEESDCSTPTGTHTRLAFLSDCEEEDIRLSRFRNDFEVLERLGKGGFGQVRGCYAHLAPRVLTSPGALVWADAGPIGNDSTTTLGSALPSKEYVFEMGDAIDGIRSPPPQVWHVRNKLDGLDYAVKSVRIKPGQDVAKLLREVNTLSRMHNTHIVRYYNAWIEVAAQHPP